MAQRTKRRSSSFTTINPAAAGIDIGATHHVVAVAADREPFPVRTFRTSDRLVDHLKRHAKSLGFTLRETTASDTRGVSEFLFSWGEERNQKGKRKKESA